MQWQLSTPSTPLPISHQSSTTGDTWSQVAEKNQSECFHFQFFLIIDQCNANWSKPVSSNTQPLNCHLDPNPIPMHCKTNTCRLLDYRSNANQEPLLYHWDKRNQCKWLGYQWTTTQPIQSQLKVHCSTTGTWHTNADDLTTLSVLIRLPMWHHLTVDPIPLENQSGTTWTVLIRQWIVVDCIILAQRHSITLDPPFVPKCAKN